MLMLYAHVPSQHLIASLGTAVVAFQRLLRMLCMLQSYSNINWLACHSRCSAIESFVVHAATDNLNSNRYECWARSQTKYVLGSDGVGRSFMVGFGDNPPVQAHHRSASCPPAPAACTFDNFNANVPNPHVLYGAMVGGEPCLLPKKSMQHPGDSVQHCISHQHNHLPMCLVTAQLQNSTMVQVGPKLVNANWY